MIFVGLHLWGEIEALGLCAQVGEDSARLEEGGVCRAIGVAVARHGEKFF